MKAITLHQPWASLIAVGAKKIETRQWRPSPLHVGQRIAIHAGKQLVSVEDAGEDFDRLVAQYLGRDWRRTIPRGAVVATAVLKQAELMTWGNRDYWPTGDEMSFGEYQLGRWMWHLADVVRLDTPVVARGERGLWTWGE